MKEKKVVTTLIKNYEAFFKFSIALAICSFSIACIVNNSLLEFAKGFSMALVIVSAIFKIRNNQITHETN
ncbi:hypothetical protein [Enterococcus sp.]|uniref:hypothetical protein n=1 Tax=Enterococcus sp. TaxID=35783 RepID=UPI0029089AF7|nr:hypothetical protein [Enterococcus sp.]MDU5333167.1 hypothetical protein [Enterococcus sp.]